MKKRLVFLLVVLLLVTAVGAAAAATYYRVNTSWLKLHQLPDYNSTVMDSYRTDFACTIVKKVNATWSKIRFTNGKEGYAVTSYLAPTKKTYSAWITDDDTNLRTGPSTTFAASGTLAKGTKVTVLSHGSAFDYVKSGSVRGYVRNSRLSTKKVAGSGKAASSTKVNYTAWVSNGNRTVNFRSAPNTSVTTVLRAYPTGTKVTVHEHGGTWDYVEIAGTYGYMQNRYLTTTEPIGSSEGAAVDPSSSSAYTGNAWVTCPNHGSVNVHLGPGAGYSNAYKVRYGWQVRIVSQVDATWYKIEYNGQTGYIMGKYLTGSKPWDAPETPAASADSDPAPASSGTSYPYTATITCAAGEKVNVRMGAGMGHSHVARLDPGTQVSVLKSIDSEWAKITVNGITGYVMKKFLR
ncbi:MAG: SH3 domain-containing protein [Clostridia bacterium]|jgi:uncharacterized protein YgiM (DUF1202 family)|nr:SH3 domain-containing protein [Clostridia bacterium]